MRLGTLVGRLRRRLLHIVGSLPLLLDASAFRRRFKSGIAETSTPWTIDEIDACFIVRDKNGQALALSGEPAHQGRGEARRLAVNFAKLPRLVAPRAAWPIAAVRRLISDFRPKERAKLRGSAKPQRPSANCDGSCSTRPCRRMSKVPSEGLPATPSGATNMRTYSELELEH